MPLAADSSARAGGRPSDQVHLMIHRTEDLVEHVKALGLRAHIAVAAADDADAIKTIHEAWSHGILDATLVGPAAAIRRIALDNAISRYAAEHKGITGEVAGRADILLAHDINMGNAIYKALQIWVKVVFAGVVVGCRTPVVVPSRVDGPQSKLQSIALAILLMKRTTDA